MMPTRRGPRCPVPGCERSRQDGHMMCRACWRRVTPATQAEVYRAWRAVSKADTLDGPEWAAYKAIREQAIRESEA